MARFLSGRRGANASTYAMIVGLVGVVAISAMALMGTDIKNVLLLTSERLGNSASNRGNGAATGGGTPVADTTPDAFVFTAVAGAARSQVFVSDIVQITGIDAAASAVIGGDATARYRICADAACSSSPPYTATAGMVPPNAYVQTQVTSPSAPDATAVATLTVGGVAGAFQVSTEAADTEPDAFAFSATSDAPPDSDITSDIVQITGINAAAPISISGNDAAYRICLDADCAAEPPFVTAQDVIEPNSYVQLRMHSHTEANMQVATDLTVGGVTAQWQAVSAQANTYPGYMGFMENYNAAPDSTILSNIVEVTQINVPVPISVQNSNYPIQYRICADATCSAQPDFTSTDGTVRAGQFVQLSFQTDGGYGNWYSTSIAIGSNYNNWWYISVGYPDEQPDDLVFNTINDAQLSQQPSEANDWMGTPVVHYSEVRLLTGFVGPITMYMENYDEFGVSAMRVCNDSTCSDNPAWNSYASGITEGKYLQLRAPSPSYLGHATQFYVSISGYNYNGMTLWTINAAPHPSSIAFANPANPQTGLNINGVTPSACYDIVVTNTGAAATSTMMSYVSGNFQKGSCANTCDNAVLQPGASCSVGIQAFIDYDRSYSGSMYVNPTDPNSFSSIYKSLSGTATGICSSPVPGCPTASQTSCGGWIANTATVAYPNAICNGTMVYGTANVTFAPGQSNISNTQIYGNATVGAGVYMYGGKVYDNAQVAGTDVRLYTTDVYGNAQVTGNSLFYNSYIYGNAVASGGAWAYSSNIYGSATISTGPHYNVYFSSGAH